MHHGLPVHVIREVQISYPARHERLTMIVGQEDAAEFVRSLIKGVPKEHFIILHLDTRHQVVSYAIGTIGTIDASLVHPREVFCEAIAQKASAIIIAHNHPSGDPTPSNEDRAVTERLEKAGEILGIRLVDSLIVTQDAFRSIMH